MKFLGLVLICALKGLDGGRKLMWGRYRRRIPFATALMLCVPVIVGAAVSNQVDPGEVEARATAARLAAACDEGEAKRDSDLCAQWYAADSAATSAKYTQAMFRLTLWQFVAGVITLIAAGAAAWFAKRAADEARKANAEARAANDEARKANRISEDATTRQLRAYLGVRDLRVENIIEGERAKFCLTIHNSGQTPAQKVKISCTWNYSPSGSDDFRPPQFPAKSGRVVHGIVEQAFFDIGPDERIEFSVEGQPNDSNMVSWPISGAGTFYFTGLVKYQDFLGCTRRTLFRGVSEKKVHNGTLAMMPPPMCWRKINGNRAT